MLLAQLDCFLAAVHFCRGFSGEGSFLSSIRAKGGVPFTEFQKLVGKAMNTAKGIPAPVPYSQSATESLAWNPQKYSYDEIASSATASSIFAPYSRRHTNMANEIQGVGNRRPKLGVHNGCSEGRHMRRVGRQEGCLRAHGFCLEWPPEVQALVCLEKIQTAPLK